MYLVVETGPYAGRHIPVNQTWPRIGRMPGNHIVLNDPLVSSNHAELRYQANSFVLRDLGSRNGTYVNGVRLGGPVYLRDGDSIQVGGTLMRVRGQAAGYPVPAAAGYPVPVGQSTYPVPGPGYTPPTPYYPPPPPVRFIGYKEPGTALILELIPGLFGFPGIGWMYAGQVGRGLATLFGWWIGAILFALATLGVGLLILPFAYLAFLAWSSYQVHEYVKWMNYWSGYPW